MISGINSKLGTESALQVIKRNTKLFDKQERQGKRGKLKDKTSEGAPRDELKKNRAEYSSEQIRCLSSSSERVGFIKHLNYKWGGTMKRMLRNFDWVDFVGDTIQFALFCLVFYGLAHM